MASGSRGMAPGEDGRPDASVHQANESAQDLYAAGRDINIINKSGPWSIRVISALIGAIAVIIVVVLVAAHVIGAASSASPSAGSRNSPTAPGGSAPLRSGGVVLATAADSPARVESMTMFKEPVGDSWATAKPLQLTSRQLAQVNQVSAGIRPLPAALDPVPLDEAASEITFVGNASGTVTINDITIAKQCSAPLTGTLFDSPAQGLNNTIRIGFDLDALDPTAQYIPGFKVNADTNFFPGHDVTLAPGEAQTFVFDVTSSHYYCKFTFQVSVVTPGGAVTEIINDSGRPFAITGSARGPYGAVYAGGVAAMIDHLNNNGYWVRDNSAAPRNLSSSVSGTRLFRAT